MLKILRAAVRVEKSRIAKSERRLREYSNADKISKEDIFRNSAYRKYTFGKLLWCHSKMGGVAELWRTSSVQYSGFAFHYFTNPQKLRENVLLMTATLIACGVDFKRSILFQQSKVPMHTELCWILSSITTMARLAHLPQFKEKSESLKNIPLGLFIYPVLQAADILLYKATHVPVGQDQAQHIQLAQDLAQIFNRQFGQTFPIPKSLISDGPSQRIKSLREPVKKMSKSDTNSKSTLNILDEPDVLLEKVKKAMTDFTSEVTYEPEKRPAVANLINIHSLFTGQTPEEICKEAIGLDTGQYKLVLADVVIEKLSPIRKDILRLTKEPIYLDEILKEGTERATELATNCWTEVTEKVFGNDIQDIKSITNTVKVM